MSSTCGVQPSSARARSQNAASRSTASRLSSMRASCEPTWKWTPATSIPSVRASSTTRSAPSAGSPNFDSSCAVWIERCVTASTPGVRRTSARLHARAGGARRLVLRVEHDGRRPPPRRRAAPRPTCCCRGRGCGRPGCRPPARTRARRASTRRRRRPPPRARAAARRSRTPSSRRRPARPAPPARYARAWARIVSSQ